MSLTEKHKAAKSESEFVQTYDFVNYTERVRIYEFVNYLIECSDVALFGNISKTIEQRHVSQIKTSSR